MRRTLLLKNEAEIDFKITNYGRITGANIFLALPQFGDLQLTYNGLIGDLEPADLLTLSVTITKKTSDIHGECSGTGSMSYSYVAGDLRCKLFSDAN